MQICPLNDGTYQGACEFCGQRADCMMLLVLKKLENLETIVAEMKKVSYS